MKNILVIAAHPDDETLGLGGTLALYSQKGYKISVLIFADGESSRGKNFSKISQRKMQAKKACSCLGIKNITFLDYKDQKLEENTLIDLAKPIEELIFKIKPEIVFTHFWGDANQDHKKIFQATLIATRPTPDVKINKIICYDTPSSTEWGVESFKPNFFVKIDKVLKKKIKALECYKKEIKKYPHPRSIKSIIIRSQYWGNVVGVKHAEPFVILREIDLC